jgi:hypothetical protein
MKTISLLTVFSVLFIFVGTQGSAQVTDPNNTATFFPQFVGFDGTGIPAKPLDIRNDFNENINILRNGFNRMQFQTENWTGLNGLNVPNANRIMIELENSNVVAAWSMLHLRDGGVSQFMRRDWFNVGTTYTAGVDLLYVGLLERPNANTLGNETDAVLAWGCQDGTDESGEVDNFRMLFLDIQSGSPSNASKTEQGREVLRVTPLGNMGVGDFSSNGFGLAQQPTHRLDVDGSGRFRQLQNNTPDVLFTGVEQDAAGDYEMNYLSFNGQNDQFLAGDGTWQTISNTGVDCDWLEVGGTDIVTGLPGTACPIEGAVSIGTTGTLGKFNTAWDPLQQPQYTANFDQRIVGTGNGTDIVHATYTQINGAWQEAFGHNIRIGSGQTTQATGFTSSVRGNEMSVGGGFHTYLASLQYGVQGFVRPECPDEVYAIYGGVGPTEICSPTQAYDHWAGYFEGDVFTSGQAYGFSDENLKTDILELQNPLGIIASLTPSSYQFAHEANPGINLPKGEQIGFIAQNVMEVLPLAVREIKLPEIYDEEGELVRETATYLGVNYDHIIPVNTAAIQEQQGIIQNQQNQINELQSTVNELMALVESCCAQMDDAKSNIPGNDIRLNQEKTELKQNRPNPFEINTTIDYSLAEGGEVVLAVYNDKGQIVAQLDQGLKASGSYSVLWNASNISQGVYYYSLKVNGVELVKKAVKL